ncbi:MAG: type III pantothenate kinase, partial [Planctomycetota bacterium]
MVNKIKQSILCIDIGNTNTKFGYFIQGKLRKIKKFTNNAIKNFKELKEKASIAIISSVNREIEKKVISLLRAGKIYVIGKDIKIDNLPLKIKYDSYSGLGADRICFAFYSFTRFIKNILNISLGTAIFIDHINNKSEFAGGIIIPGLNLQYQALRQCHRLKNIRFKNIEDKILGNNTEECISIGVSLSIINLIKFYEKATKSKHIVMSGGDYRTIKDLLGKGT